MRDYIEIEPRLMAYDPEDEMTPLHSLCSGIRAGWWIVPYENSAQKGRILIALGWDANTQTRSTRETACHVLLRCVIHDAIEQGHRWSRNEGFSLLRVLIDAGADFSKKDCAGFSAARIVFNYTWRCNKAGFPLDITDEVREKYPGEYAEWVALQDTEGTV